MQKTAIIVPCYNEENRLDGPAFSQFAGLHRDIYFFFVNDGSSDRTAETLAGLCQANPIQMHYIGLKKNQGKAEAVRQGVLEAFKGDFDNIGYWDADLATPLGTIQTMCSYLNGSNATAVIGSRVRLLGRKIKRRALRHYLGRLFATMASLLLKLPIYDTQCGAKIFRNSSELKMAFRLPFKVRWIFDVELLLRLIIIETARRRSPAGATWAEHPLDEWVDVEGSKMRCLHFLASGVELTKIFLLVYIPSSKKRYTKNLLAQQG